MASSTFVILDESRRYYAAVFVLREISQKNIFLSKDLDEEDEIIHPFIDSLKASGYIYEDADDCYAITPKGEEFLHSFMDRYNQFLADYDIFCGVDLRNQDFAFNYFERFPDPEEWYAFLDQERWIDLRIAVAEYKGFDAVEIVFMSLVNDERFGRDEEGWKEELLTGIVWDEIQAIVNNAIRLGSLSYEHEGRQIPAEAVIRSVIERGRSLAKSMRVRGSVGAASSL